MSIREAIEAGDAAGLSEFLADDVVFRSPAVYTPYEGKDTVLALLGVVAQVFENFRYANQWRDGDTEILFFETNVGKYELQGVDILRYDESGKVAEFTVMIRPLSGLYGLAQAIQAKLEGR